MKLSTFFFALVCHTLTALYAGEDFRTPVAANGSSREGDVIGPVACARAGETYSIVVDRNGTGHFTTIQEAIDAVPDFHTGETVVIFIKKGTYREKLVLPGTKRRIRLVGEDRDQTVVSYGDYASLRNMGTSQTYTFLIAGEEITVEDLTVENTAGRVGQAVALLTDGDRILFFNCRFLGNQDTVYTRKQGGRVYFGDCYIEGTTDFIFGSSTAWFEGCTLHAKQDSYITAASTPETSPYGYIFNRCRVTLAEGVTSVYLGRPWRPYAMTLFMHTELPAGICREGWHNWGKESNEQTARYQEYKNYGPGADTSGRVGWSKELTDEEARQYEIPRDTSFTIWQTYVKERKYRPYIEIADPRPTGIVAREGVVYSTRTDLPVGIRELRMNIYRPEGDEPLPALLMVHGGGWNSGDLTLQVPMAREIASRGYVTVPVEYRLIPEALYPAAVYDLKDAIRYLRAHASEYGIDPDRIAISGCSAGGQLANLIGATNDREDYEQIRSCFGVSSRVQAVINMDGVSDFTAAESVDRAREAREAGRELPVDAIWLGGTYEERREIWEGASPLYQVTAHSAPVCFINSSIPRFHKGRDEQMEKLARLGIWSEVHTLDDTPHPFWFFHPWFRPATEIMVNFLDKVLK
ncbi:MAG: pectinesterase family protein [Bacteroides sp.]|nr:pectinesterase family protein [Bacteroides sp.]